MAERPILFSAPMVRAILDGRKTATRRLLKPQPFDDGYHQGPVFLDLVKDGVAYFSAEAVGGAAVRECEVTGRWQVGDRLYVRETTEVDEDTSDALRLSRYSADKAPVLVSGASDPAFNGTVAHWDYPRRSRPGIHLPKWASRIWLEVTAVRVERLQELTADQAIAEGMTTNLREGDAVAHLRYQFGELWDGLAKPGTRWANNPWAWVVEFRRIDGGDN